jgi:hypothetical protein
MRLIVQPDAGVAPIVTAIKQANAAARASEEQASANS